MSRKIQLDFDEPKQKTIGKIPMVKGFPQSPRDPAKWESRLVVDNEYLTMRTVEGEVVAVEQSGFVSDIETMQRGASPEKLTIELGQKLFEQLYPFIKFTEIRDEFSYRRKLAARIFVVKGPK